MFFSNKNLISFSYFGRPWLHRIKFKLLKKEYKIFYVGSCLFSLPSIPTTLQALQPYQTTSVHNTLPISKLQSFILSGVTFPYFVWYTLCSSFKTQFKPSPPESLDFPRDSLTPCSDFTLYVPLLEYLSLCTVIMSVSSNLTRL